MFFCSTGQQSQGLTGIWEVQEIFQDQDIRGGFGVLSQSVSWKLLKASEICLLIPFGGFPLLPPSPQLLTKGTSLPLDLGSVPWVSPAPAAVSPGCPPLLLTPAQDLTPLTPTNNELHWAIWPSLAELLHFNPILLSSFHLCSRALVISYMASPADPPGASKGELFPAALMDEAAGEWIQGIRHGLCSPSGAACLKMLHKGAFY